MKNNKKILLGSVLVPFVLATPVAVAVSCGTNNKNETNITREEKIKQKALETYKEAKVSKVEMSKYSATPYSANAVNGILDVFKNINETYFANFKGELKGKSIKVLDQAIIALYGYLTASNETTKEIKEAKATFASELATLKIDINELFDAIFTNKDSGVNLVLNKVVASGTMQDITKVLSLKIFGKLKFMINNMIDTMINIEDTSKNAPAWTKDKNIINKGTYADLQKLSKDYDAKEKAKDDAQKAVDSNNNNIKSSNDELTSLKSEKTKVDETIKNLEDDILNKTNKISKLEDATKAKEKELITANADEGLKKKEFDKAFKIFNESKKELKIKTDAQTAADVELAKKQKDLIDAQTNFNNANKAVKDIEVKILNANKQLNSLNKSFKAATGKQDEITQLGKDKIAAEDLVKTTKAALVSATIARDSANTAATTAKDEFDIVETKHKLNTDSKNQLQSELDAKTHARKTIEADKEALENKIKGLNSEKTQASDNLAINKKRKGEIPTEIDNSQQKNNDLLNERVELNKKLKETKDTFASMSKKIEDVNLFKGIESAMNNQLKQDKEKILFKKSGEYDALKDSNGFGLLFVNGKFKTPEQAMIGSGWQSGLKMVYTTANQHPESINVKYNTKTKKTYFDIKTTTTDLANNLKKEVKYDEKHTTALLNDPLLNEFLITPFIKTGKMAEFGISKIISMVLNLGTYKSQIKGLIGNIDSMLADFGKMLQFTELDMQMFVANLTGNEASYYGEFDLNANNTYDLNRDAFMTPQFNAYSYKNYQSNNKNISTQGAILAISKAGHNIKLKTKEFIKAITVDPYSNYTFSILELAEAANINELIKKIKI